MMIRLADRLMAARSMTLRASQHRSSANTRKLFFPNGRGTHENFVIRKIKIAINKPEESLPFTTLDTKYRKD